MQTYILGAYVAIFSTVYNYVLGQEIKLYSGGRYAGVGNANDLALVLTIGLPIAWHLVSASDNRLNKRIMKLINLVYLPAASFAIILTGTRTAIFAVLPAFAYILWTTNRLKPTVRILVFIALVCSIFLIQPYIPQSAIERFGTTSASLASGDLGGRIKLWNGALSIFLDHPYWGIGSGALSSEHELGAVAHNTFLSVLAEVGLIGFLLLLCILAIIAYQITKQNKHYAQLWTTVWAIWAIGVFTLTWEYRKVTWLILTLTVVSANLFEARKTTNDTTSFLDNSKAISYPPNILK
jgi:O-antigen ligase